MEVVKNDCLDELRKLPNESINLIYLDPPFFTQKEQALVTKDGKRYFFNDLWENIDDYIIFIKERLYEMKRVLKCDGNIFLHCDTSASHYLRIALDEVFEPKNFRSEIIWNYRRWSNSKKGLLNGHQTVLYYSKTKNYKFNYIFSDYSETTNVDQILQERVRNEQGRTTYKTDEFGNVIKGANKKGVPLSDVWNIPYLNPKAKERVGYPTQKPILLLERIIYIGSDEGDTVLDPFCGSGTTLVAAKLMGRKYLGIDINPEAIDLTLKRLENPIKTESQLLKRGRAFYDTKTDQEKAILSEFPCDIVQRNKGLDGILRQKYNGKGIGIRIQRGFETIKEAESELLKAMDKRDFEISILVRTHHDCLHTLDNIDNRIIVIDDYKLQLATKIEPLYKQ